MSTEGKEDVGNGKIWNVDMERWTNISSLLVFNIFLCSSCVTFIILSMHMFKNRVESTHPGRTPVVTRVSVSPSVILETVVFFYNALMLPNNCFCMPQFSNVSQELFLSLCRTLFIILQILYSVVYHILLFFHSVVSWLTEHLDSQITF